MFCVYLHYINAFFPLQVLRSADRWSTGTCENSILKAYIHTIENSQHFIYIEVINWLSSRHFHYLNNLKPVKLITFFCYVPFKSSCTRQTTAKNVPVTLNYFYTHRKEWKSECSHSSDPFLSRYLSPFLASQDLMLSHHLPCPLTSEPVFHQLCRGEDHI